MIWIFMEGEGDEIKSKQASKRDRTLLSKLQHTASKNSWLGVVICLNIIPSDISM